MNLKQKEKAAMLNRLISVYNNATIHSDICLSVIAICMLLNSHTDEELTRSGSRFDSTRQNQL